MYAISALLHLSRVTVGLLDLLIIKPLDYPTFGLLNSVVLYSCWARIDALPVGGRLSQSGPDADGDLNLTKIAD